MSRRLLILMVLGIMVFSLSANAMHQRFIHTVAATAKDVQITKAKVTDVPAVSKFKSELYGKVGYYNPAMKPPVKGIAKQHIDTRQTSTLGLGAGITSKRTAPTRNIASARLFGIS